MAWVAGQGRRIGLYPGVTARRTPLSQRRLSADDGLALVSETVALTRLSGGRSGFVRRRARLTGSKALRRATICCDRQANLTALLDESH